MALEVADEWVYAPYGVGAERCCGINRVRPLKPQVEEPPAQIWPASTFPKDLYQGIQRSLVIRHKERLALRNAFEGFGRAAQAANQRGIARGANQGRLV